MGSRRIALGRLPDLTLSGIDLTEIIPKVWIINGQYDIDVSLSTIELRC